jgi:hypothetical protein
MSTLPHKTVGTHDFPQSLVEHPDLTILIDRLQKGNRFDRKRALVIFAHRYGVRGNLIRKTVDISPVTYRRYIRVFDEGGAGPLFARRINPHRKFDKSLLRRQYTVPVYFFLAIASAEHGRSAPLHYSHLAFEVSNLL